MRRVFIVIAATLLSSPGTAQADEKAKANLAGEIHTTFQPLLWNYRGNMLQMSAGGEIQITEGRGLPTLLGKNAQDALRAAARRLHRRYGGRRSFTVEAFGDNLHVTVGGSSRSKRRGSHHIAVEGTGGFLRSVTHVMAGPGGIERSRSHNTITGARERRLTAPDGRRWIKLRGGDGGFGIVRTTRGGRSKGLISVPAPGSSEPAIRTRPDGTKTTMSAKAARRAYGWIRARAARKP
jgi:hypothetical protein